MKFSTAVLISASAALTSATGPDYNPDTNTWTCHVPDAVYCAGDSLKTNIIIRCTGLVGYAGNCNDNLAGEPPVGVQPSLCYAPELHSAACAKNCIVYGGSGNLGGTFPLPSDLCTPTEPEPTATTVTHTSEPQPTGTTSEPEPTLTTITHTSEPQPTGTTSEPEPTLTTITHTSEPQPTGTTSEPEPTSTVEPTEPPHTDEPTQPPHTDKPTPLPPVTITITISDCPVPTTPLPPVPSTFPPINNGTVTSGTAHPTGGNGNGGNTHTPIGPSSTLTPPVPGAGVKNAASLGMVVFAAVVGFAV